MLSLVRYQKSLMWLKILEFLQFMVILYTCILLSQSFKTFKKFLNFMCFIKCKFWKRMEKITLLEKLITLNVPQSFDLTFFIISVQIKQEEKLYKISWSPWCQYYALECNYIYLFVPVGIFYYNINLCLFTFLRFFYLQLHIHLH